MLIHLAVVRDYMLEKSRVVYQSDNEGVFHIFYALFAGCPRDTLEDLFLASDMDQYRYRWNILVVYVDMVYIKYLWMIQLLFWLLLIRNIEISRHIS